MSDDLPLGREVPYPAGYAPGALRGIRRADGRERIGLGAKLPFVGEDVWNAYELTWLAPRGMPRVAVLTLRVPCSSPRVVESKSLKLYLGGFAQTAFANADALLEIIDHDLAGVLGSRATLALAPVDELPAPVAPRGFCLDALEPPIRRYEIAPELLTPMAERGGDAVYTHLFRSLCPVTGQPDYASIAISWSGRLVERESLLAYLVSYRTSAGFHEDAVERVFMDMLQATSPTRLAVRGHFLRRGGIDINPFRSTADPVAPPGRLARQ